MSLLNAFLLASTITFGVLGVITLGVYVVENYGENTLAGISIIIVLISLTTLFYGME